MSQEATDESSPPPDHALDQMAAIPLAGRLIGLDVSQFVIAEWTAPGHTGGPPRPVAPLHVHNADDEAWYVLAGALTVRLGDQEVEAPAGSAIFAPRGVPHTYWNARPDPARYLLIMPPNLRRLIDALHLPENRAPEAMRETFRRHASTLLS